MQVCGPAHPRARALTVTTQDLANHHILLGPRQQFGAVLHPGQTSQGVGTAEQVEGVGRPRAGGGGRHARGDTARQPVTDAGCAGTGGGKHQ